MMRLASTASLPLVAMALLGGCAQEASEPVNVSNRAAVAPPPAPSPQEVAQGLVRRRLGSAAANPVFGQADVFNNGGAAIVCGRVTVGGQEQRYIAVGDEDVFLESQMQPGQMDQAVAETCANAAARPIANASDVAPALPSMENRVNSAPVTRN